MRACEDCCNLVELGVYTLTDPTRFYCSSDCFWNAEDTTDSGDPKPMPLIADSGWLLSMVGRLVQEGAEHHRPLLEMVQRDVNPSFVPTEWLAAQGAGEAGPMA